MKFMADFFEQCDKSNRSYGKELSARTRLIKDPIDATLQNEDRPTVRAMVQALARFILDDGIRKFLLEFHPKVYTQALEALGIEEFTSVLITVAEPYKPLKYFVMIDDDGIARFSPSRVKATVFASKDEAVKFRQSSQFEKGAEAYMDKRQASSLRFGFVEVRWTS